MYVYLTPYPYQQLLCHCPRAYVRCNMDICAMYIALSKCNMRLRIAFQLAPSKPTSMLIHPNWSGQRVCPNYRGSRMHPNCWGSPMHPSGRGSSMHPNGWGSRAWPGQGKRCAWASPSWLVLKTSRQIEMQHVFYIACNKHITRAICIHLG